MNNKISRMLPHCAILICNMYIVFFLIDRVNTAMNFIDNGLTKGLLLIMSLVSGWCSLWMLTGRRRRNGGIQAIWPKVNLLACGICLILLLIDLIWKKIYLFNANLTKFGVLAICLITFVNSAMMIGNFRAAMRRSRRPMPRRNDSMNRGMPPRRQAPYAPAAPVAPVAPVAPAAPEYRGRFAESDGRRYSENRYYR